jgi:hypothetical protein
MTEKKVLLKIVTIFIIGIIIGVASSQLYLTISAPNPFPSSSLTLDKLYQDAIAEVMVTEQTVTYSGLTPIVEDNTNLLWQGESENKSVLFVVFTKYASSYPVGQTVNNTWGDIWVTIAPDLQCFFKNNVTDCTNLTLRAAQLLGLPPNTSNNYFIELWVQPQYLFRPTADNEINDTTAQIAFPSTASSIYQKWFNDNIIYSYYPPRYPWTRLGYTYDWGNSDSHIGLCEYVIPQNSLFEVKTINSADNYLKP